MKRTPPGRIHALACRVAAGSSVLAASKNLDINPRTARGLVKQEPFLTYLAEAQREILSRCANSNSRLVIKADKRLAKLIDHADPEIALRALKIAKDCHVPYQMLERINLRITALEAAHDIAPDG